MDGVQTTPAAAGGTRQPTRACARSGRDDLTRQHSRVRVVATARVKQSLEHVPLSVEIDHAKYVVDWGVNDFVVEPGQHVVTVCFRYCWGDRGRASRHIYAETGSVVELAYRSPYFVFIARGALVEG